MKLALNLSLFLLALGMLGNKSFSLSDYEITKICKKEKKKLACMRNLKEKRADLQQGKLIEIPVTPHKR